MVSSPIRMERSNHKGNGKECSNYYTNALISHASKVRLKILQAKFPKYMNQELPDVQAGFRKDRGVRFSCSVMSSSLRPLGLQHACPSPTSRAHSKLMSIKSVMPSNHLILCCPLLLLSSIFPSIRVFSNESVLRIRWPKYWSFSFSKGRGNRDQIANIHWIIEKVREFQKNI